MMTITVDTTPCINCGHKVDVIWYKEHYGLCSACIADKVRGWIVRKSDGKRLPVIDVQLDQICVIEFFDYADDDITPRALKLWHDRNRYTELVSSVNSSISQTKGDKVMPHSDAPQRETQVQRELNILEKAVSRLEDSCGKMEARIQSVLAPDMTKNCLAENKIEVGPTAPLAERLASISNNVNRLCSVLDSLTSRIEL